MNVAEVMGSVDDPEFLVARCEVENLLVLGEDNERRKPEFGPNGDDVLFRVLHDTRLRVCGARGRSAESDRAEEDGSESAKEWTTGRPVKRLFHRTAPFEMGWSCWELLSRSENRPAKHWAAEMNAVNNPAIASGRNGRSGSRAIATGLRKG